MGVTDKIWGALTSIIKLEDKVNRQSDAMKTQQTKIEDLTARDSLRGAVGYADAGRAVACTSGRITFQIAR